MRVFPRLHQHTNRFVLSPIRRPDHKFPGQRENRPSGRPLLNALFVIRAFRENPSSRSPRLNALRFRFILDFENLDIEIFSF